MMIKYIYIFNFQKIIYELLDKFSILNIDQKILCILHYSVKNEKINVSRMSFDCDS